MINVGFLFSRCPKDTECTRIVGKEQLKAEGPNLGLSDAVQLSLRDGLRGDVMGRTDSRLTGEILVLEASLHVLLEVSGPLRR